MSLLSAVPGQTINTTIVLPQAAVAPVKYVVRDHLGNVVARGTYQPSGTMVIASFVLPSSATVPLDGSKYSITATDGVTSATEYFSVVSNEQLYNDHGVEVAYMKGEPFVDTIRLPDVPEALSAAVYLADGTPVIPETPVSTSSPIRAGQAYVFRLSSGAIDTATASTMGLATVSWKYTLPNAIDEDLEIHPVYTITPYAMTYMNAIRKLVDRARLGDTNQYMAVTPTDLVHGLIRGADMVMQSDPLMTGFPLDLMPRMLHDFIVKAAAVDILRSMYLAEGMSVFDMQGLGVQLNVDRTQYLDGLIQQLTNDLQLLPNAKKKWLEQGAPMGPNIPAFKRPVGVLGLTTGTYTNWPMIPVPFRMLSSSIYSWTKYGPLN